MAGTEEERCKTFEIPCLYDIPGLKYICLTEGIKFHLKCRKYMSLRNRRVKEDNHEAKDSSYEVEDIIEDVVEKGIHWYLVKWKNYPVCQCTWEPSKHLTSCDKLLSDYHRSKNASMMKSLPQNIGTTDVLKLIYSMIKKKIPDVATLIKLCAIFGIDTVSANNHVTTAAANDMKKQILQRAELSKKRLSKVRQDICNIFEFYKWRLSSLKKLKFWEEEINIVLHSAHTYRLHVVNHVDCEDPPDFKFINDYIFVGINVEKDLLVGCECLECCSDGRCCAQLAGQEFAYKMNGYLKLNPGYPIYECNSRCKCGETCCNRVIQKGVQVKLEIFRTADGRGWGLRTMQPLKRGQFIVEYLGEVITSEAAELRRYNDGDSYLFDLDYEHSNNPYTVDAKYFGNASHFINHSCEPNLDVFAAWVDHLDPKLPRLAFFANRNIHCGEELTFDYRMHKSVASALDSSCSHEEIDAKKKKKKSAGIPCRCGAENCRGYLF